MSIHSPMRQSDRKIVLLLGAIITLGNLGTILHKSSRVFLFQQAQCFNYYRAHDPTLISSDLKIKEPLCKLPMIQSRLSIVDGVDSFLQCLPPLLVLGMYREIVERIGLRCVLVLNLCCAALAVSYSIVSFWLHQTWTTEVALLSFLFDLIGGGDSVRITMACACIANIMPAEHLTNVYNYISGFYFLASVFGSAVGSLLLSHHVYILNGLSISCYLITMMLALVVPSNCGRDKSKDQSGQAISTPDETDPLISGVLNGDTYAPRPSSTHQSPFQSIIRSGRASYTSLLTLFASPNPTFTVILILLINGLAVRIDAILPQYTSVVLDWPLASVNRLMALKALVSAVSLFTLPLTRRLYLEPRFPDGSEGVPAIDLFITQASLTANAIGAIGLGFSAGVPLFVVALCVYTSGAGLGDSLTSFGTHTLAKGEVVADFYLRTGLVNALAALLGGPLWSVALSLVIRSEWVPLGLPFCVCAGLFGAGCAGVAILKRFG